MKSPETASNARKVYEGGGSGLFGNGRPRPGLKQECLIGVAGGDGNGTHVQPFASSIWRVAPPAWAGMASTPANAVDPTSHTSAIAARNRSLALRICVLLFAASRAARPGKGMIPWDGPCRPYDVRRILRVDGPPL